MSDSTTSVPPSGIGQLRWSDLWKGLIKSCSGLLVGVLIKCLQEKTIPTYGQIEPLLEAGVYFLVGYLGINAATNNEGKLFKADAPTVTVSKEVLDEKTK